MPSRALVNVLNHPTANHSLSKASQIRKQFTLRFANAPRRRIRRVQVQAGRAADAPTARELSPPACASQLPQPVVSHCHPRLAKGNTDRDSKHALQRAVLFAHSLRLQQPQHQHRSHLGKASVLCTAQRLARERSSSASSPTPQLASANSASVRRIADERRSHLLFAVRADHEALRTLDLLVRW